MDSSPQMIRSWRISSCTLITSRTSGSSQEASGGATALPLMSRWTRAARGRNFVRMSNSRVEAGTEAAASAGVPAAVGVPADDGAREAAGVPADIVAPAGARAPARVGAQAPRRVLFEAGVAAGVGVLLRATGLVDVGTPFAGRRVQVGKRVGAGAGRVRADVAAAASARAAAGDGALPSAGAGARAGAGAAVAVPASMEAQDASRRMGVSPGAAAPAADRCMAWRST